MSKVYTLMLRRHGDTAGLMMYQARAKSFNAVVLLMKVQGIVPQFDVLSYTERPAREFVTGILFPRTIKAGNDEAVTTGSGWTQYLKPIVCWLKRQHLLHTWQDNGRYCERCKAVFPNE